MRVLILSAHHDDETLGCGSTIARLAAEGHDVRVLVLGEGPAAREGTDHRNAIKNSEAAIKHLGGALYVNGVCGLPDNQFDTVPLLEIAKRIEAIIRDFQPEVVYTHYLGDLNQDHRATANATLIATRAYASAVDRVYMYEVSGATDCTFVPNVYQGFTPEQLERKVEAMEMYVTERRPDPHPRSPEVLRALAKVRGSQSGHMFAEAFELVRWVR